jgi:hypothetical protein
VWEELVVGTPTARPAAPLRTPVRAIRRDLVALRIEDDGAARAFARAGRLKAGVFKEEVEHTALARVHGWEAEGLAGIVDLIDGVFCGVLKCCGTSGFVAVGVKGDAVVVFRFEAKHLGGEMFQRAEQFAITLDEQRSIRAFAFHVDVAAFEAVGVRCARACGDAVLETETAGGGE